MIEVWYASAAVSDAELARYEALLTPAERARAARFRFERDRRRAIVSRGRLRELLARYTGDTEIVEDGKPALRTGGIEFNVSHSGELIVYAFAPAPVGIDIETIRDLAEDADRILPGSTKETFFDLWTKKEAVVKAAGVGISGTVTEDDWVVRAIPAPEGYRAAVASHGDAIRLMTERIFTIGHSTRDLADFIRLLKENGVERLADIRRYPGSRRYPHFSREALRLSLPAEGIEYVHMPELGGRRKPDPDSRNTAWRNEQFRAYADHMGTDEFREAVDRLLASPERTAYMCAEAVPWRCHRNLLSDELTRRGIEVIHILGVGQTQRHSLNPHAVIDGDHITYPL